MNFKTLLAPPQKTSILGVGVSRTNYHECTEFIIQNAKLRESCTVAPTHVHGIMSGYLDREHGSYLNQFTMVTPDGQPVRWALNLLRQSGDVPLRERVCGPVLTLHICQRAAQENLSVFFYGSTEPVLEKLQRNLKRQFPNLKIAGTISPPFRPLSDEEQAEYIEQIRASGASIVFVGLGCPRQEKWAFEHRHQLNCPLICIGAAFDFHSGNLPLAPAWMQNAGLEWLFRLTQEPTRLWKRYLLLNPLYVMLLGAQIAGLLPDGGSNDVETTPADRRRRAASLGKRRLVSTSIDSGSRP
ncbi:WecB/TagA/CpsF family glycosyltransferase [Oscillatoriales cyanobacterium LEGE 11467]|uniref:WecB/TagA/CpsF family glycosyltransferase n=1 Tax=Zarconia navalis LEGE 11467 TaxID=1828826 RepID=A0A928VVW2_9CYAN|nr:WecB/TagA/CpsF family glycosyltransferase [Zarconia navalis]MBE9041121.1 WecB/TagA/CpsF family glycosyltransferase [Zarconia navalis LEGE 11467]